MTKLSNLQLIEVYIKDEGVSYRLCDADEGVETIDRWFKAFGNNHRRNARNELNWHCFVGQNSNALGQEKALEYYQKQWVAPIVIFDESEDWVVECEVKSLPDFSSLQKDIYVSHHNMKWTMAFTHEQPWIGPFFAIKN